MTPAMTSSVTRVVTFRIDDVMIASRLTVSCCWFLSLQGCMYTDPIRAVNRSATARQAERTPSRPETAEATRLKGNASEIRRILL